MLNFVEARIPGDIVDGHKIPDIVGCHSPTLRSVEHHVARRHHAVEGWTHLQRVDVQSNKKILDHRLERQPKPPAEARLMDSGVSPSQTSRKVIG
jgi:hypothetical protein